MEGDVILVEEHHRRAAGEITEALFDSIQASDGVYTITISGESGSGKSETAKALAEALASKGASSLILQQDDYFALPPRSNDRHRRADLSWVGPQEVNLALIESHLRLAHRGESQLVKPLVVYDDDKIVTETVSLDGVAVVIAEGTYTALLLNVASKIFIARTREDTLDDRRRRNREASDPFLEKVLEIEHDIISRHAEKANIIIHRDYSVEFVEGR
jgi:uridine kinase